MTTKPRNPLLAWHQLAAGSVAAKQQAKKRRPASADYSNIKPSRLARRKGRGR